MVKQIRKAGLLITVISYNICTSAAYSNYSALLYLAVVYQQTATSDQKCYCNITFVSYYYSID